MNPFQRLSDYIKQVNQTQYYTINTYTTKERKLKEELEGKSNERKFAGRIDFMKYEKVLAKEFQLVYTDLEHILEWPNGYLTPTVEPRSKSPLEIKSVDKPRKCNSRVVLFSSHAV